MKKDKTNLFIFITVLLVILSIVLAISGVISWFSSSSYKAKFVFAALSLVSAFLFPIIASIVNTKKELSSGQKQNTSTPAAASVESEPSKIMLVVPSDEMRQRFDDELNEIPLVDIDLSKKSITRRRLSDMPEIKTSNVTRATNPEKIFPLVVLDTETTGFQPSSHAIVELSAIKFEYPFSPVAAFSTLINPEKRIPADASEVNGITNAMVKDSPVFSEIAPAFSGFIRGCNICGHNLPFDLRFLFASGLELPSGVKYYDTLDLAKKTLVKEGSKDYNHHTSKYEENEEWDVTDHKLETLCEYYGIYRGTQHRALSDSYATAQVFKHLLADKSDLTFPEK